jgi:hypothetical protein
MLRDIASGNASVVISDKRERFVRKLSEAAEIGDLVSNGAKFHFAVDER